MGGSTSTLASLYNKAGVKATVSKIVEADTAQRLCAMLNNSGVSVSQEQIEGSPKMGGVTGGGYGTCVGGYDALTDYGNSLYSKAKEELIRNIARDVFRALKSSSADKVATAKISEVVEQLSKLVPDPRKGKNFNAEFAKSAGKQTEVCKALGSAINSNYGAHIINLEADPAEICRQVAEVMYSLFTGLHSEFMSVAGDITRILKNMDTVNDALESAYKKQKEYVMASGDDNARQQSQNTDALYNEIKKEAQRQRAMMQNLFNIVIVPSTRDLVNSLEENQDFASLVSSLKVQTGTRAFSDKLSMLLSGISSVARNAELINKALKKLGMSTAEFKASKTSDDLHMKIYSKIIEAKPNSKRLSEMMKAANIIYANNYNHEAVSKLIDKSKGNKEDDNLDSYEVQGGADEDDEDDGPRLTGYWGNKSLIKKMSDKKKFRNTMLKDFRKLLAGQYRTIITAANNISQEIGKSIPLGQDLDIFIDSFEKLPSLDRDNLHIALSGYYKDSGSREERSKFVDAYTVLLRVIEKMPKMDEFNKMASAIKTLLRTLDEFSDNILKSLTEIHVDAPHEVKNGRRIEVADILGGDSGDSGDDVFGSGTWVDFKKVQTELRYYRSIANIKINISRSLADRREYAEGYEQTLGEFSGKLIDNITNKYKELIEAVKGTAPTGLGTANEVFAEEYLNDQRKSAVMVHHAVNTAIGANHFETDNSKLKNNLIKIYEMFQKAKVNMVKVAQAVDMYMKAFSTGISANPDILSSTVKMLDSVEMVAKWYNERSGDNLALLFESFPAGRGLQGRMANAGQSDGAAVGPYEFFGIGADQKTPFADSKFAGHYYETLEAKRAAGNASLPANPFIGRCLRPLPSAGLDKIIKLSESSVKTMRALENILSAFQSVGSKFGDLDPQSQTFMTPGQMFNYLCDYVKAAAFTTEFLPQITNVTSARYHSTMEEQNINPGPANVPELHTTLRPPTVNVTFTPDAVLADGAAQAVWSQDLAYMNSAFINGDNKTTQGPGVKYGIVTGVSTEDVSLANVGAAASDKYISLALAGIPADSKSSVCDTWTYHSSGIDGTDNKYRIDLAGWRDHFYDTDMLFTMTIKALVAKVFTVVDAYRLFHRPATEKRAYMASAPVRTILGGAASVQVMPEALELYYRLPLLIEWYREQFRIDRDLNIRDNEYILTIAPTIDGVFGDLTQVICEDGGNITEGNYTETQVQRIITEINNIWKAYKVKYPKATTRNIINAYVLDINRVLGFIRKIDITKYLENRRDRYTASTDNPINSEENDFLDFDILNANGQYSTNKSAPSDRFTTSNLLTGLKTPVQASVFLMKQIHEMRAKMDKEFNRFVRSGGTQAINFSSTIRNYQSELELAKDPAGEYKIVLRMMQGGNQLVQNDVDIMVMAHEAVAAPLATLYAVWRVMHKFNSTMHGVSLVNLGKLNNTRNELTGGIAGNNNFYTAYEAYFAGETQYKNITPEAKQHFITSLIGNYYTANYSAGVDGGAVATNAAINADNCGFINAALAGGKLTTAILKSADMFRALLSMVLDLHSNTANLTSCSIGANGNVNIDLTPLRDTCGALLSNVKSNILALRTSFPDTAALAKYENVRTPGTTRWIEENLMEVLFNDRDKCGLNTGITSHLIPTLNKFASSRGDVNGFISSGTNSADESYGSMYDAFASMLFYKRSPLNSFALDHSRCNVNRFPFNIAVTNSSVYASDAKQLMNTDEISVALGAAAAARTVSRAELNMLLDIPQLAFCDYAHLDKFNPAYPVKSLLFAFNQFLRNYIYCNTDPNTLKSYLPLYEAFAAGSAGYEIGQFKAFQDVYAMQEDAFFTTANAGVGLNIEANAPFTYGEPLNLPGERSLVFNSNAILIRKIIAAETQVGSIMKRKHLYESFAEIPETMRDKMKTNLPYFSKMLQQFYSRSEFLFKYLNNSKVKNNLERAAVVGALGINVTEAKYKAAEFKDITAGPELTAPMTIYFSSQLTKFMELSLNLKKCADSVYKELNDKPFYYLETNKDFITDYKSRTGNIPFMPVSSLLAPLRMFDLPVSDWDNSTDSAGHLLLPVPETNSLVFKFNAGSKIIMARDDLEPSVDQMPGVKEIYNHYNSHAAGTKISATEYATSVKNMVKLVRFLTNGAVYNRFYDTEAFSFDMAEGLFIAIENSEAAYNGGRNAYNGGANLTDKYMRAVRAAANNNGAIAGGTGPSRAANADPNGARIRVLHTLKVLNSRKYASSGIFTNLHWEAPRQFPGTLYGPTAPADRALTIVPLNVRLAQVLELTESTSIRLSKDLIMNTIGLGGNAAANTTRADLRTSNILDMDIVPINVHAFMREVPFVNLMNYSYTFDRMAHEFINPEYYSSDDNPTLMPADAPISSTRELLVKLLVHPYADLGTNGKEYYALLASLFNGNDNMRLGIAKYLSDQLWHKVLLTSSAQLAAENNIDFPSMEAGPAAYEATNAIIHYGTRVSSSDFASAAAVKFIMKDHGLVKVLTQALRTENASVLRFRNAAAHDNPTEAHNNASIMHRADAVAEAGAAVPHIDAGLANATAFTNAPLNGAVATAVAILPIEYIAVAARIPTAYSSNDPAAFKNVIKLNGGVDIEAFTKKLTDYMFGLRGDGRDGGIIWQAETAQNIVTVEAFNAFLVRCSVTALAALVNANPAAAPPVLGGNAEFKTVDAFCTSMREGAIAAGAIAADASHIGDDDGTHYARTARNNIVAGSSKAHVLAQISQQVHDVIHHGLFQAGNDPTEANKLVQRLRNTQNQLNIDITTMNAVPNSLRAGGVANEPNGSGTAAGVGIQTNGCIAYANPDYSGLDPRLNLNLPGVDAALNIFTEFLYLFRPFRQYKSLRNLAQTLFLVSLYQLDNTIACKALFNRLIEHTPTEPRWVRYFVQYMIDRIHTQASVAGLQVPRRFSLGADDAGSRLGGAALTGVFADGARFGGAAGADGVLTIDNGNATDRYHCRPDFIERMRELIALSYCNPIMVVDEIPRLLTDYESSNAYLSVASLPNMTPGLKIRDKNNKNKWKIVHAGNNPPNMTTPEVIYCAEIGRARFDTKIVRNLSWFVQLQRVMRVVLTNHLSWINSPVVRGLKIADASMTELHGNDSYDANAFNGGIYRGQI